MRLSTVLLLTLLAMGPAPSVFSAPETPSAGNGTVLTVSGRHGGGHHPGLHNGHHFRHPGFTHDRHFRGHDDRHFGTHDRFLFRHDQRHFFGHDHRRHSGYDPRHFLPRDRYLYDHRHSPYLPHGYYQGHVPGISVCVRSGSALVCIRD